MFITYRIHHIQNQRVHNVSEKFVLSWLKVDQGYDDPAEKLKQLKRDCFIHGHLKTGAIFGGSYLVMTLEPSKKP